MILTPELLEWFLSVTSTADDQDLNFSKKDIQGRFRMFANENYPDATVFNKLFSSIPNIIDPRFIAKTTDDNINQAISTLNTTIKHGLVTLTTDLQAEQRDDGDTTKVSRTIRPSQIVVNGSKSVDTETLFKAVPTINTPIGILFQYRDTVTGNLMVYKLESGTDIEASPTLLRPDDYTISTNEKVWKQALIGGVAEFTSSLSNTLAMPSAWNSLAAGTTIGDLQGKPFTEVFTDALFPTVLAYIQTNSSMNVSGFSTTQVEVGTSYAPSIISTFNQGQINNGDNSNAGTVSGLLASIEAFDPTNPLAIYTNNSPISPDATVLPAYILQQGNNTWTVKSTNIAGTTTYTDNKGGTATIASIEAAKVDTQPTDVLVTKAASYRRWYYLGGGTTSPITSGDVRVLSDTALLTVSNTGSFTIPLPLLTGTPGAGTTEEEISFYIPSGKTISVQDIGNNNDVTANFLAGANAINVNDANGQVVSYTRYTYYLGVGGFNTATSFNIIIT